MKMLGRIPISSTLLLRFWQRQDFFSSHLQVAILWLVSNVAFTSKGGE
jgi:hypothetical protein